MAYTLPTGFFAYPSQPPMLPETIRAAVELINNSKRVHVQTWEDARVGGKAIIGQICKSIETADLLLADLTGLNPNVLFEVGFAIAKNKRVWPALDTSIGATEFSELRTLSTIGYARYTSSGDIAKAYFKDLPHEDLSSTLFDTLIKPHLTPGVPPTLLYLKSQHETDASVHITKRLDRIPVRLVVDDPREDPSQTLSWYGQQVYAADAVLCHLTNPARQGARIRNARYALVAGMAFGLNKNVLILSEGDYLAPLDYRDILRQYQTIAAATRHLDAWLPPLEDGWRNTEKSRDQYSTALRLATELKGLNLGEYIAENEGDRLVDGYFIETMAYSEALSGTHTIFVGRKGTGKSANFLQLAARLRADSRNILSVMKPVAYELESVLRIFSTLQSRDKKVYAIEALWKLLLYSEIASSLEEKLSSRPPSAWTEKEIKYLEFFKQNESVLTGDFSSRLERCIASLQNEAEDQATEQNTDEYRQRISHTLHAGLLKELRESLVGVVPRGGRVAIVIDNLDKAWDRQNDLRLLAEFLLGLLSAGNKLRHDMKNSRTDIEVSVAVFLRADIFEKVQEVAREPDKIKYTRLTWTDHEMLFKLVDERFAAANGEAAQGRSVWEEYFCAAVAGIPTKQFVADAVLPRPRDFLYLVKEAISVAVNRGHPRVEESDILEARRVYSEFASGILLIEDNSQDGALERVLYEFAGATSPITHEDAYQRIHAAGVGEDGIDHVINQLCSLSFFGVEVAAGDFRFPENSTELKKVAVLSRRLCEARGSSPVYAIHPAFRPFLEVNEHIL